MRLSQFLLAAVDRLPAGVRYVLWRALLQELLQRVPVWVLGLRQAAGVEVLEDQVDGLLRVLLVRADDARGSTLDPADRVLAGLRATAVQHAAALVRDHAAPLVERHAGQRHPAVPDRAEDEPARDLLRLLGGLWPKRAVLAAVQLVADDADRLYLAVTDDFHRGDQETEHDATVAPHRRLGGVLAEYLDVLARGDVALALDRRGAQRVELAVLGVDEHVGAGHLAQLQQLGVGEGGLGRAAAAEHHDLLDVRLAQGL